MKQKVSLEFHDLHKLWAFAQAIQAINLEINTRKMLLTCNCREQDVELAQELYGAKLVHRQEAV